MSPGPPGDARDARDDPSRAPSVHEPRSQDVDVRDEDVARLSPFVRHHINMRGRYSFQLPDLPGGLRTLRNKDATGEE